jgi:hypothetical protein
VKAECAEFVWKQLGLLMYPLTCSEKAQFVAERSLAMLLCITYGGCNIYYSVLEQQFLDEVT